MSNFDPELLELMPDWITVEHKLGQDQWKNPTYASTFSVRANVVKTKTRGPDFGKNDSERGPKKDNAVTLYVPPCGIETYDRITLPGGVVVFANEVTDWRDVPDPGDWIQEVTTVYEN